MKFFFVLIALCFGAQARATTPLLPAKCPTEGVQFIWSDAKESLGKVYFAGLQACVSGTPYEILSSITSKSQRTEFAHGLCQTMGFTYFVGAIERTIPSAEVLATFSADGKFEKIQTYEPALDNGEYLVTALDTLVCKGL